MRRQRQLPRAGDPDAALPSDGDVPSIEDPADALTPDATPSDPLDATGDDAPAIETAADAPGETASDTRPAGTARVGEACPTASACAPGLTCSSTATSPVFTEPVCVGRCTPPETWCDDGRGLCLSSGVCAPGCTPRTATARGPAAPASPAAVRGDRLAIRSCRPRTPRSLRVSSAIASSRARPTPTAPPSAHDVFRVAASGPRPARPDRLPRAVHRATPVE
jgi:hypothetical protein